MSDFLIFWILAFAALVGIAFVKWVEKKLERRRLRTRLYRLCNR